MIRHVVCCELFQAWNDSWRGTGKVEYIWNYAADYYTGPEFRFSARLVRFRFLHWEVGIFCWQFGNWSNWLHSSCLTTWILIEIDNFFNNDDIMTSLLKKLSISIKTGVIKHYGVCMVSFQTVDRIRRQSSWASCEFCSHRQRDKTVSSCRRCVLGMSNYLLYTCILILLCYLLGLGWRLWPYNTGLDIRPSIPTSAVCTQIVAESFYIKIYVKFRYWILVGESAVICQLPL